MAKALIPGGAYLAGGVWRDASGNPLPEATVAELEARLKAEAEEAKTEGGEAQDSAPKRKK